MKRILILLLFVALGLDADGAVSRGSSGVMRQGTDNQRVSTTGVTGRSSVMRMAGPRTATTASVSRNTKSRDVSTQKTRSGRVVTTTPVVSRAVTTMSQVSEKLSGTNVGAAYDKCKAAYFACMDQFCELKNDDYRRCSCSSRIDSLADLRKTLTDAGDKLTVFTENLEIVGMTAAQAAAMRTPSDGEKAFSADTSASNAILQAIMNSIRGDKADVAGKYSELNSLNLSFDTVNAFGTSDVGQVVAAYDGQDLYNAVYPQCRQAVKADCTDSALQRAVTAYLMGIEQDCNAVQTAIEKKQTELKSALREGSAMLDLARIENRQKHNSADFTACLNNVEAAILSEEVCGADYHRCLDDGEYIDISTGAPIKGVVDFYKLQEMLTFNTDVDAASQKLSKVYSNQLFVKNFENRVKKFALPVLDACTENADDVWADYLDKAMLDIYYAQQAKVAEIKQGCFDFVAQCYMNAEASITAAMKDLIGNTGLSVQPYAISLNTEMCKDYVNSCDNMFGGGIVAEYVKERQDSDMLTACRAVVKQCFDSYGGSNYENFYYPYSGLIINSESDSLIDWFTLYDTDGNIVSQCAKQIADIDACKDKLKEAFGGLDFLTVNGGNGSYSSMNEGMKLYGYEPDDNNTTKIFIHRGLRPTGVATEIYNQVIDILTTECDNLGGKFKPHQDMIDYLSNKYNECKDITNRNTDVCPRGYDESVHVPSWGACLCSENDGRTSNNGKSAKCVSSNSSE